MRVIDRIHAFDAFDIVRESRAEGEGDYLIDDFRGPDGEDRDDDVAGGQYPDEADGHEDEGVDEFRRDGGDNETPALLEAAFASMMVFHLREDDTIGELAEEIRHETRQGHPRSESEDELELPLVRPEIGTGPRSDEHDHECREDFHCHTGPDDPPRTSIPIDLGQDIIEDEGDREYQSRAVQGEVADLDELRTEDRNQDERRTEYPREDTVESEFSCLGRRKCCLHSAQVIGLWDFRQGYFNSTAA